MIAAGLTGSIAMGKSTVAAMFAAEGAPVFDADRAVHDYYASQEALEVEAAFPGVWSGDRIDRAALSSLVLADAAAMRRLEAIVHPAVAMRRQRFLASAWAKACRVAILDIPLLFETGAQKSVDCIIVVSAPAAMQKQRALAREGMTAERFAAILSRQTSDEQKRRGAHIIIDTSGSLEKTQAQTRGVLKMLTTMTGRSAHHA